MMGHRFIWKENILYSQRDSLNWIGIDQSMKMRETSRAVDKELLVNNDLFLNPERVTMPDWNENYMFSPQSSLSEMMGVKPLELLGSGKALCATA